MSPLHGRLTTRGGPGLRVAQGSARAQEHFGCQVLLSGHLADREALGQRLGLRAPSSTIADAELAAAAYRRWGRDLQSQLRGEYAAVIFDGGSGEALLTHDALGATHLFHTERDGELVFAADLADIAPGEEDGDLDENYMADFLALGFISGARTPYRSIRRLEPGASLWWRGGAVEVFRGWDLNAVAPIRYGADGDYEAHFRDLLTQAVRGSMAMDGPTWISLSGGLDSASIACVAAELGAPDLAAYSVFCAAWPETDERPWMKAVVDHCAMPWRAVDLWPLLPFSQLPQWTHGEPTQAVIHEAQLRNRNALMAEHGAKVMLNGHAGDAVLCASPGLMPHHLADPLFLGDPLGALRGVADWQRGSPSGRSLAFWMLRGLAEPALRRLGRRRPVGIELDGPVSSWLRRDYAAAMDLRRRAHARISPPCRTPGLQALSDDLWMLSLATAAVAPRHLTFDQRHPLLDRPLVEFMAAIPWSQKLRPDQDRHLQRRALRGVLPEAVRRRTDKGSANPLLVEGLRRSRDWLDYLRDESALADHGVVDREAWRLAVTRASIGHTQNDKLFLAAVALEVWLRRRSAGRARGPGRDAMAGAPALA